jgi:hypothetical protein
LVVVGALSLTATNATATAPAGPSVSIAASFTVVNPPGPCVTLNSTSFSFGLLQLGATTWATVPTTSTLPVVSSCTTAAETLQASVGTSTVAGGVLQPDPCITVCAVDRFGFGLEPGIANDPVAFNAAVAAPTYTPKFILGTSPISLTGFSLAASGSAAFGPVFKTPAPRSHGAGTTATITATLLATVTL